MCLTLNSCDGCGVKTSLPCDGMQFVVWAQTGIGKTARAACCKAPTFDLPAARGASARWDQTRTGFKKKQWPWIGPFCNSMYHRAHWMVPAPCRGVFLPDFRGCMCQWGRKQCWPQRNVCKAIQQRVSRLRQFTALPGLGLGDGAKVTIHVTELMLIL